MSAVLRACNARVPSFLFALTCLALASACSNDVPVELEDAGAGVDDSAAANETLQASDLGGVDPDATDITVALDGTGNCPGGVGCPCVDPKDCDNFVCLESADGPRCAKSCTGDCAPGYQCRPTTATDVTFYCIYAQLRLCDPCKTGADCKFTGMPDAECVEQGANGSFCGIPCGPTTACPTGYDCQVTKSIDGKKTDQCVRAADADKPGIGTCPCSGSAVAKQLSTVCFQETKNSAGEVTGKCEGSRVCGAAGLGPCTASVAAVETCNGKDDDCDGVTDESACDDAQPCTQDLCDGKGGCTTVKLDGVACADGNACTDADTCVAGVCKAGPPKACDDKNVCTKDDCQPASGCIQAFDDGKPCEDNNLCTTDGNCKQGVCKLGTPIVCETEDACYVGKCSLVDGKCVFAPKADGSPCTLDDACVVDAKCTNQNCVGKPKPCGDDDPCTDYAGCKKDTGCVFVAASATCTDADACTTGDACVDKKCVGKVLDCDDKNPCTADTCDKAKGCVAKPVTGPCDDGIGCTTDDFCVNGACKGNASGDDCTCVGDDGCKDDGNKCNGTPYCVFTEKTAKCATKPGTSVACDPVDPNGCTTNACNPKTGTCEAGVAMDAKACSDGSKCTLGDFCKDGKCTPSAAKSCNDGEPCTVDFCDPVSGECVYEKVGDKCTDNDPCTDGDVCKAGKCAPGPAVVCVTANDGPCELSKCDPKTAKCATFSLVDGKPCEADGNVCTEGETCQGGNCKVGSVKACDDGNPCTKDACDPKSGCQVSPAVGACDDGKPCTVGDACSGGKCVSGKAKICDDGNACTGDACDAANGACSHPNQDGDCSTGSKCTSGDACKAGTCVAGGAVACDDKNGCTTDSCDAKAGCKFEKTTAPCEDGSMCTKGDACLDGACKPGAAVACDDQNPCTDDAQCDAAAGCKYAPNKAKCEDGNSCTVNDVCGDAKCIGTSIGDCSDGNVCTKDGCSATGGCQHDPIGGTCDDGKACTGDAC